MPDGLGLSVKLRQHVSNVVVSMCRISFLAGARWVRAECEIWTACLQCSGLYLWDLFHGWTLSWESCSSLHGDALASHLGLHLSVSMSPMEWSLCVRSLAWLDTLVGDLLQLGRWCSGYGKPDGIAPECKIDSACFQCSSHYLCAVIM